MRRTIVLPLLFISFLFACKKEGKNSLQEEKQTDLLSVFKDKMTAPKPVVNLSSQSTNSKGLIAARKISSTVTDVTTWANNQGKTLTVESDDILISNENYDFAYPGAIFDSKEIVNDYVFVPFGDRDYDVLPIRASLSIPGTNVGDKIEYPSLDATRNFVGQIVARQGNVPQINSFSYTSSQFTDYNELKYTFGANVNVGVSGDGTKIKKRTGVIAKFTQENFTVDMSLPKRTELISISDAKLLMVDYAPVYVNSVTYGRSGVYIAETDASYEDFNLAFKAGLNIGVVKSDVNLTLAQKQLLDKAQITIYMKFGPGKAFTKTVNSYEDFKNAMIEGADVASDSYGGPISFRMRNLSNFSLFKTVFKIDLRN
ncbi:thiol-activated cytolysin family protein [Pedobacter sp. MW01-1-1]|uniref:thiol-activated cytolysin family protein n=1 Tax=Pedobacter sp. MW01-1-1 TaxID=3383027 RepID=UPI003FEED049